MLPRRPAEHKGLWVLRRMLEARILVSDLANRPIPLDGGAALVMGFLHKIIRIGPSTLSPTAVSLVREQLLDLRVVSPGNLTGITPRLDAANRFAILRLRAAVKKPS